MRTLTQNLLSLLKNLLKMSGPREGRNQLLYSKKKEVTNQMDVIPHFNEVAELQEYLEREEAVPAKRKQPISASFGQYSKLAPDSQKKKLKQTSPIDLYFRQDVDENVKQGDKKDVKL